MSETRQDTPKMRRGVRVLLFASLAVNLLVAGLVVGAVVSHRTGDSHRPPRIDQVGGPMARALSREDRRALGREMREAQGDRRGTRAEIRAEFDKMIVALEASPYDSAVVRESLERQMQGIEQGAQLGFELLLQRLDAMSDAERAAYAARLREELTRKRRPEGRRKPHWH